MFNRILKHLNAAFGIYIISCHPKAYYDTILLPYLKLNNKLQPSPQPVRNNIPPICGLGASVGHEPKASIQHDATKVTYRGYIISYGRLFYLKLLIQSPQYILPDWNLIL